MVFGVRCRREFEESLGPVPQRCRYRSWLVAALEMKAQLSRSLLQSSVYMIVCDVRFFLCRSISAVACFSSCAGQSTDEARKPLEDEGMAFEVVRDSSRGCEVHLIYSNVRGGSQAPLVAAQPMFEYLAWYEAVYQYRGWSHCMRR